MLPSKSDADAWLKAQRSNKIQAESGQPITQGSADGATYAQLIPELLRWYESGTRRAYTPRALESYRAELRRVERDLGHRVVSRMRLADIDAWVGRLRDDGLASSTIRHHLDRLSAIHQLAVRQGYLARLPCRVERPRNVQISAAVPLTDRELSRLVAAARRHPDRRVLAVILLALDAGLRRSEMLLLRGEDVDLRRGFLRLAVRGEQADRPKSGRERSVPILTARLRAALAGLEREPGQSLLGIRSRHGAQGMATRAWEPALGGRAQLHRLRHGFATRAAEAGFAPVLVQAWLGHRSVATTMRYVHPDPRQVDEEARERFEAGPRGGRKVARSRRA